MKQKIIGLLFGLSSLIPRLEAQPPLQTLRNPQLVQQEHPWQSSDIRNLEAVQDSPFPKNLSAPYLQNKIYIEPPQDTLGLSNSDETFPQLLKEDLLRGIGGFTNAFIQPLRWEKEDWLIAGGVAIGTVAIYSIDQESSDFFTRNRKDVPHILRETGSAATPEHFFLFNGAVYLTGLVTKNEKLRDTGVLLLSSSTAASLMLAAGKWAVGRARPYTGAGKAAFDPFSTEADWHSFPSGHALLSVTTAYAIGKKIQNPWLKGGIYTLGLVGPVSRLWEGAHWLSDVGLSIALGIAVVEGVDHYLNRPKEEDEFHSGIKWSFQFGPGAIGLTGKF